MPLPAESLTTPGSRALVQTLEAFVGRASKLRTAVAEAQAALDALERDLQQRRRHQEATSAARRQLQDELARSEARLHELQTERREGSRHPSPPPRTVPGIQVLRAEDDLTQRIGVQRQQLLVADRHAVDAQRDVSITAQEVERQRQTLAGLEEELRRAPTEPEVAAALAAAAGGGGPEGPRPSALASADIPAAYLDLYRRAARTCPGLSWTVLAAIGSVESSHGRSTLPGVGSGANAAGAMGPMQFLAETWATYGKDGDSDGIADVYRPADAVSGAANYLCASGAGDPSKLAEAIWAYNHADWYVVSVLSRAAAYGTAALGMVGDDLAALVDHPNLNVSAEARADLLSGEVDPRVVAVLAAAVVDHRIEVTVIRTGHSQFVRGTDRVSNHYHGRAVDIFSVDGQAVSASNQAALRFALAVLTADASLRPDELGSPWPDLAQFPGAFSDADHADHLHFGWSSGDAASPSGPLPIR